MLILTSAAVLAPRPSSGDVALSAGDCGLPGDVEARGEWMSKNNTGKDATNLEFQLCSDPGFVHGAGAKLTGAFTGGNATLDPNPLDPKNTCVGFTFNGGTVPPGGTVDLQASVWLKAHNAVFVRNSTWTTGNGVPSGGAPPLPTGGWRVDPPRQGGDGGNPNPGGGGRGGQEGGGGTGNWIHDVMIVNDADKSVVLQNLLLLASMTRYGSLSQDVPWSRVQPIDFGGGATSVTIAPHSAFDYLFNTTGAYFGGHVYLNYHVIDDDYQVYGDHPTGVPEPSSLLMASFGAIVIALYAWRRRGTVSA
jgi:hypothetical protein